MSEFKPHQQRVVDEKRELDAKIAKLGEFIDGPTFIRDGDAERIRLRLQLKYMIQYSDVLEERLRKAMTKTIIKVSKITAHVVDTDEAEFSHYTRYSATSWFVTMGESDEPVYDCEELEKAFQKFLTNGA